MSSQQTSGITGAQIIEYVREDYNDTTTEHFSASEMLRFKNDGEIEISIKSHGIQATESVTLTTDREYPIVAQYTEIKAVFYNPASGVGGGLEKGSIEDAGRIQGAAFGDTVKPAKWYEFAGQIGVYPALTSVTTETITLYLAKRAVATAVGDAIQTPAIYDNALKKYMLARMFLKDKNFSTYSGLMAEVDAILKFYRKDLQDDAER